jgi:hypothetical protein
MCVAARRYAAEQPNEVAPFHPLGIAFTADGQGDSITDLRVSRQGFAALRDINPTNDRIGSNSAFAVLFQRPLPPTADIAPRWLWAAMCHNRTHAVQQV